MSGRHIGKTLELKVGEHEVDGLGEMQPGERIPGYVKDLVYDKILFMIVDEPIYRRFMEGEVEEGESGLTVRDRPPQAL